MSSTGVPSSHLLCSGKFGGLEEGQKRGQGEELDLQRCESGVKQEMRKLDGKCLLLRLCGQLRECPSQTEQGRANTAAGTEGGCQKGLD